MARPTPIEILGWACAVLVPAGMLIFAWLYASGILAAPRPMWSALDPLPLTIELAGPVGLAVAILAHRGWPAVGRIIVAVIALPTYLYAEFMALLTLSGAMGAPF